MSPEIQIYQATEVAENILINKGGIITSLLILLNTLKGGMPMKHTTE
ncbi:hypothetical protein [Thermoanaerobacterium xylanolyticum]|nr:hypothetical protein [Thermoanaerobacterium xylanolyticum]